MIKLRKLGMTELAYSLCDEGESVTQRQLKLVRMRGL